MNVMIFFSDDGSTLVTRSGDTEFQAWNAKTGKALSPVIRPEGTLSGDHLAISPNGRVMRARTGGLTNFFDSATLNSNKRVLSLLKLFYAVFQVLY